MVTNQKRPAGPSAPQLTLSWFSHTSYQLLLYRIYMFTQAITSLCQALEYNSEECGHEIWMLLPFFLSVKVKVKPNGVTIFFILAQRGVLWYF